MYLFILFWLGLLTAGAIDGAWSWWWLWVWLYGLLSFAAGVGFTLWAAAQVLNGRWVRS